MIGLTYLIFFISIIGFCIVALLTFIQYLKRFKTDADTQNRKMKKLSRLLIVFAIGLIVSPIVGAILTGKENSEENTKKTEKKEIVEATTEEPTTEEPSTEAPTTEEITSEEPTTEEVTTEEVSEDTPDDDKTPEQLQEKVESLLEENLYDGTVKDVQFFKDSQGTNLMIEVEPISLASEDTIKDILVQAFQAVSYTDAEYDSVQVSVVEDDTYIGKAKLGNDGIYSIRNKDNETDFDNLEMFAEEEITIEPN